jgi:hypothetical protein
MLTSTSQCTRDTEHYDEPSKNNSSRTLTYIALAFQNTKHGDPNIHFTRSIHQLHATVQYNTMINILQSKIKVQYTYYCTVHYVVPNWTIRIMSGATFLLVL